MDGKEFPGPINADIVKKYYAWDNKESDLLELKTWEGSSSREKWKKNKKKRKRFKVETRKDSLNHKKWNK